MREAVIVSTARTPIGKAYRGAFNDTPAPTLGGHAIAAALGRAHVAADDVDDVVMGAAMQQGWRCQSNGASSTRSATCPLASDDLRCKGAPLGQCGRASLLVHLAGDEMALLIEMVVDLGVN